MSDTDAAISSAFARSLAFAERRAVPFRHWLLADALPAADARQTQDVQPAARVRGRRTARRLIYLVNYVVPEWRARHELAFPSVPVA